MTHIVPASGTLVGYPSALSLPRYAALINYPECAFWGVANDDEQAREECRVFWTKYQRDTIAKYLAEAQFELEEEISYFLSPRFVVGTLADEPNSDDRYVDVREWQGSCRLVSRWPKIISLGTQVVTDIELCSLVDHTTDPAVVGPIATTETDPDAIHIYHPGTDVEINPSSITIAGGVVTIEIPRCRLVNEANADNPSTGLDYNDVGNCALSVPVEGVFECCVDVKAITIDTTLPATLVSSTTCCGTCADGCSEHTTAVCGRVRDGRIGFVEINNGSVAGCDCPSQVRLNYLAGTKALTLQAEDAILRLAHAKMPDQPCSCDFVGKLWERDRHIPDILTAERLNNPFGINDGAHIAWRFARGMKMYKGTSF